MYDKHQHFAIDILFLTHAYIITHISHYRPGTSVFDTVVTEKSKFKPHNTHYG